MKTSWRKLNCTDNLSNLKIAIVKACKMAEFDLDDNDFLASLVSEISATEIPSGTMDDFSLASLEEEMLRDILGGVDSSAEPAELNETTKVYSEKNDEIESNFYNLNDVNASEQQNISVQQNKEMLISPDSHDISGLSRDVILPNSENEFLVILPNSENELLTTLEDTNVKKKDDAVSNKSSIPHISDDVEATVKDSDDFMSWLESKEPEKISDPTPITTIDGTLSNNQIGQDLELLPSTKGMDSFFDEVFGGDITGSETISILPLQFTGVEREIGDIIRSSFPDISNLKKLITNAGYVPAGLRGQVWSLLLTGSCTEDQEAEFWRSTGLELPNHSELELDCSILVDKYVTHLDRATSNPSEDTLSNTVSRASAATSTTVDLDLDQVKNDMKDLLVLYCVRRGTKYHSSLGYLLLPLVLAPTPVPRSLASSCFYSLCSTFLPLLDPKPPGLAIATRSLHSWFRLLIGYHYPRLLMHLDRVLYQGWEQAAPYLSPAEAKKAKALQKSSVDLDAMENDVLGPEEQEPTGRPSTASVPTPLSFSRKKRNAPQLGLVPSNWLLGLFSSSLTPGTCSLLWDWVFLRGERYAGLYLATALLGHFEASLLSSSGPQVEAWFVSAGSDCPDWFSALPSDSQTPETDKTIAFISAWTTAAAALMRDTPRGLAVALEGLETWAELRQQSPLADSPPALGSLDPNVAFAQNPTPVMSNPAAALLGRVRGLGRKLRQIQGHSEDDDLDAWADEEEGPGVLREWLQDSLAGSACLLAEPAEVVPCICASSRRGAGSVSESDSAIKHRSSSSYLSPATAIGPLHPAALEFFAVDCRASFERRVGRFPKALIFDPKALTDPDELSSLMASLTPFMDSSHNLHICLIGAGEAYIRMNIRLMRGDPSVHGMPTGSSAEAERLVQEAMAEQAVRLNAVAVFFMKRSFSRISVLYGGFAGAAKFLISEQSSLSLSSALVDAHGPSIDMLLGGTDLLRQGAGRAGKMQPGKGGSSGLYPYSSAEQEPSQPGSGTAATALRDNLTSVADKAKELAAEGAREVLGNLGNRLVSFRAATIASIKKKVSVAYDEKEGSTVGESSAPNSSADSTEPSNNQLNEKSNNNNATVPAKARQAGARASTSTFTIDSDEEDNDAGGDLEGGEGKAPTADDEASKENAQGTAKIPDTSSISITRTEAEKSQALAMHHLSGLSKGDSITISRECLPGAVLFPAIVQKEDSDDEGDEDQESHGMAAAAASDSASAAQLIHRYLVVTRERFIVIDSSGGGVGSLGRVVSNHHLTELLKMTFRKRDPDMVTIFFVSSNPEPKTKQFRVSKREEFVQCLQKHMQRFK